MTLIGSMLNGVSGLQTTQRQMQIVSGNVANANVDGYSRKTADLETVVLGTRGAGVDLGTVRREVDSFLVREVRRQQTDLSNLETLSRFQNRLQELFGTLGNDSTLANTLNNLQGAMEALAVDPESAATRNDVLEAAGEVVQQFNRFSRETQSLRAESDNQIDDAVDAVNTALIELRDLNEEIATAVATGDPTGELEDQRDQALATIAETLDIRTFERGTGEMVVMDASGNLLVDRTANLLDFTPTGGFTPGSAGNTVTLSASGAVLDSSIGGRLGALLQVRDSALPDFQADIDRLAGQIREQVNEAHNLGTFANAPAASITGNRDFTDAGGTAADGIAGVSGSFEIVEADATGNVSASTTIDLDAAPSDPGLSAINTVGDLVQEINFQFGGAVASFAGNQLQLAAPSGQDIALRTGDARVDGDLGDRNLSHYFGLNDFFETPNVPGDPVAAPDGVTGAAQSLQVRADIVADPDLLSRAEAHTDVGQSVLPVGDPTIAQNMAAIFEQRLQFADPGTGPGSLDGRSTTLAGFAGDILQFQARESARLQNQAEFQGALRDELSFRAQSHSGVNIDEEMSKLVNLEQSFNASARVISTVQEMFDVLDAMVA